MPIIVEDGTGVEGANSYASVPDLIDYVNERGIGLSAFSNEELEALLIRSMDYIGAKFGARFKGQRVEQDQALDWPRSGAWVDGYKIANDSIPRNLVYGQLAAAVEGDSQDLLPNPTAARKRERVEGAVEVEYFEPGKVSAVSAFAKADTLLFVLCENSGMFLVRS